MADTRTTHTAWCAGQHDPGDGCLSVSTSFPALGVTVWLGQTDAGDQVVVDASRPVAGTPDEVSAFAQWLAAFVAPAVSPSPAGGARC